ncbi:MAG: hypothetical protein AB7T49_04800 [Oligoflexales bacterium]
MRILRATLGLTLIITACGKDSENHEKEGSKKSAEAIVKEMGIPISANDSIVMKIDKEGHATLVKTQSEPVGDDLETIVANEEKLFENPESSIMTLKGDDDILDSSTESWGFNGFDCFNNEAKIKVTVKVKGKIHGDKFHQKNKYKEKIKGCGAFGPTFGFGAVNVGFRPVGFFPNVATGAGFFRFRPWAVTGPFGAANFGCGGRAFC